MLMESQAQFWKRVITAKRKVLETIPGKPDAEFRSKQVYQAYTGLCGEAEFAHEDKQLDEEIVKMLEAAAEKVLWAWNEHMKIK
jgi:hypothetical protein